jgi:hypothetical protein
MRGLPKGPQANDRIGRLANSGLRSDPLSELHFKILIPGSGEVHSYHVLITATAISILISQVETFVGCLNN